MTESELQKISVFLGEEFGYKGHFVQHIKPTHGSCCTCQECGFYHDDCVCSNNRIYNFLISLSSQE